MLITEKNKKLNIDFNKDNVPDIELWKDLYGSHIKVGNTTIGDFPEVHKVEDYLYEITIDEIDEQYYKELLLNPYGFCSEVRNGNFIGRTYDWTYSNNCSFIVRTLPKENRHASIGVSSVSVTEQEIENKIYNEKLKLIPYQILDGINDCSVYCGINVVPQGDKGITKGTNPDKKDLPNISIPRFVLDKSSSAKEAVELLKLMNIHAVRYDNEIIELHALIADANDTFIVEFIDNKMVVIPYTDKKAIMTNFYLDGWNGEIAAKWLGNTDKQIKETGLTPHAEGLERYLILKDGIEDVKSLSDTYNLMKQVEFTKAYNKDMNPFWYSELTGARNLTIYNSAEEYSEIRDIFIDMYENRNRDDSKTWQTVHCSCYDLSNKKFIISVQENNTQYEYSLNVNNNLKEYNKFKTLSELKKKI